MTEAENGLEYRAVFSNAAGSVTSATATLSVQAPPTVTQQPASTTIEAGRKRQLRSSGLRLSDADAAVGSLDERRQHVESDRRSDGRTTDARKPERPPKAAATTVRSFKNSAGTTASNEATLTVATSRSSAVAWGSNIYRQLGDGFKETSSSVPVIVSGLQFVTAVSAGGRHSLALLADGTVVAWGADGVGQLGDDSTTESAVPVAVQGLSGVTAISAGSNHSLALLANGTVMAWGSNETGQLGIGSGSIEDSTVPVPVKGLSGVKAIAAGTNFSLALLSNGTVMSWGENESGQLGTGSLASTNAPVVVKNLTGVAAIAAGEEFSLALLTNGTVKAWGDDSRGELANAGVEEEQTLSKVAVPVEHLAGVTAIAAGARHALALLSGGTVMAWGDDASGELGNGVVKPSAPVPVAVSGLSGVTAISAGTQDSAALLGSGSVMTWGTNSSGVLGEGSNATISDVPVTVVGLRKASSVSVGRMQMLAFGEPLPDVTARQPAGGLEQRRHAGDDHRQRARRRDGRSVRRDAGEQLHRERVRLDHRDRAARQRHRRHHRHDAVRHEPDRRRRPLHLSTSADDQEAVAENRPSDGRHDRDDHRHRIHSSECGLLRPEPGRIHRQLIDVDRRRLATGSSRHEPTSRLRTRPARARSRRKIASPTRPSSKASRRAPAHRPAARV